MKNIRLIVLSFVAAVAGTIAVFFTLVYKPVQTSETLVEPLKTTAITDSQFSLTPTAMDSAGVAADASFTLKSETALTEDQIKEHLKISPEFVYKVESSDSNTFTLVPKDGLQANTIYTFALATETDTAAQRTYQWAYQIKDTFKITGTLPRNEGTGVPVDSGIEITFSHEQYTGYDKYITIQPEVKGRFEQYRKTLVFVPESLKAGTIYTVTVKAGLPLENSSETLAADYVFAFETVPEGNRQQMLSFDSSFFEFPEQEKPVLSLYTSRGAGDKVDVNVWQFPLFTEFADAVASQNQIPAWALYARQNSLYPTNSLNLVSTFSGEIKVSDFTKYLELPEAPSAGQYLIEVVDGDKRTQAFLQMTNLAASFVSSDTQSFIWLHDLASGAAVASAGLTFSGDVAFSALTDDSGVAIFDTPRQLTDLTDHYQIPYTFTVASGTTKLLVPIAGYEDYGYYGFGMAAGQKSYWSYLYTNRTLYLPTDSIKVWGVAKSRSGSALNDVQITLTTQNYYLPNSSEMVIEEKNLPVSDFDTFEGEFTFSNLNPGTYQVRVKVGDDILANQYVSIETYTKPAYTIDVSTPKKAIFEGDTAVFDLWAHFFDGTPVAGLQLEYLGPFGNGKVTTDDNGKVHLELATPTVNPEWSPDFAYLTVHPVQTELANIETSGNMYVFGPRYGIDVRAETSGNITGTVYAVDLSRINSSEDFTWDFRGNPVPNTKAQVTVKRTWFDKIETGTRYDFINKKTYKTYRYEPREEQVSDGSATTNQDGQFVYTFTPIKDQSYTITVHADDGTGRTAVRSTYLYTGPRFYGGYGGFDSYYLDFGNQSGDTDPVFANGDTVSLNFYKNEVLMEKVNSKPYLYFRDHNGIFDVSSSDSPTVAFDFKESYAPNLFQYGVYFDGRSYHMTPGKRVTYDKNQKALTIGIKTDKDAYRPGENVTMDLTVTDKDNQPVKGEVNVSLIDEALAAIQWNNTVATLSRLYAQIPSSLQYAYSSHRETMAPGAEGGGCFTGETKILMADGSEKPISEIRVGEKILTRESPESTKLVESEIIGTTEHTVGNYLTINGGINVTPEHIVRLNDRWQPIGNAKIGDKLESAAGEHIAITSIRERHTPVKVYNLHTRGTHTFIAQGVYVHNEKAGGRENFQDVAFFGSVQTDSDGKGQVKFALPDNVTSWQTTVQAVTKDLQAGGTQSAVIATLPYFVDVAVTDTYLASDTPKVKIRSFGTGVNANDVVTYTVTYSDKSIKATEYKLKVHESLEIDLPDLPEGRHSITVKGTVGSQTDTVTKFFAVASTNRLTTLVKEYPLEESTVIGGSETLPTTVRFMNRERGQYYQTLQNLSWTWGDRIDERMGRRVSRQLRNTYFGENETPEDITFSSYQTPEGGVAILPYASGELLVTAKAIELAPDVFDREAARTYFASILEGKNVNLDEVTSALFGMANLGEPVLNDILALISNHELSSMQKLYLARGLANLGAVEYASSIVDGVITQYGESVDPYIRVNVSNVPDDVTEATYQAAIVSAMASKADARKLFSYAQEQYSTTTLFVFEELAYLTRALPLLSGEPVSFTYTIGGDAQNVSLTKNDVHTTLFTLDELKKLKFSNIQGAVGAVALYQSAAQKTDTQTEANLGIKRAYSVNGKNTTTFKENDVVKISLTPQVGKGAIDSEYQLTDYLPAGLAILTNPYSRNIGYDQTINYPYEINGRAVKFWVGKPAKAFSYYAIVTSKGGYTAEGPVLQGFVVPDSVVYGESQNVTVK